MRTNRRQKNDKRRLIFTVGTSLALCASTLNMSGCATAPTPQEIETQTDDVIRTINRVMDEAVGRCNGDQSCINTVNQHRQELIAKAIEARLEALQENWQDARERRRELEREILELLPNFPDLKPVIDLIYGSSSTSSTILDFDIDGNPVLIILAGGSSGSSSSGTTNVLTMLADAETALSNAPLVEPGSDLEVILEQLDEPAIGELYTDDSQIYAKLSGIRKLRFTGPTTVTLNGSSLTGNLILNLFVSESVGQDGTYYATVNSGTGNWNSSAINAQFSVEPLGENAIFIPGEGAGIITLLLDINYSNSAWASIMPRYQTFHVPITRDGDHFQVAAGPMGLYDYAPHIEHPASDYNRDGILDHTTDYAAFIQGLAVQDTIADMNHDGAWDTQDHTIWNTLFQIDLDARELP